MSASDKARIIRAKARSVAARGYRRLRGRSGPEPIRSISPPTDGRRPVNFAIVGCGQIAPTHVRALRSLPGWATVTQCCNDDPKPARRLANAFALRHASFEDILADPEIDAISVCTPSGLHADVGVPALLAGKHVVVEKPMEVTVEACDRLLDAQRSSGKALAVVCQHRFDEASQRVKRSVDSGELGRLVHADCRIPWYRTQDYYDSGDWRGTWELDGGGCLMNQGLHSVDLLRWLCGPVKSVYAEARTATHERIEVEDLICATISFENGAVGVLSASTSTYPAFPARVGVHGTLGGAVIEGDSMLAFALVGGRHEPAEAPKPHAVNVASGGTRAAALPVQDEPEATPKPDPWGEAHRRELLDFVEAAHDGRPPLVDGEQGRNTVELIEAIYRSARSGRVELL